MPVHLDDPDPHRRTPLASGAADALRRTAVRTLADSLYALSAFPIALANFVPALVLLATGLGLSPVVVGVLLVGVAVGVARWFAGLDRTRLLALQARPSPSPTYRRAGSADGFWRSAVTPLLDPQSWRDIAWALLAPLSATAAAVVTLTWWAAAGAGLTSWGWQLVVPSGVGASTLASLIGLGEGGVQESVVDFAIGAFALGSLPHLARFAAASHATVARALLVDRSTPTT